MSFHTKKRLSGGVLLLALILLSIGAAFAGDGGHGAKYDFPDPVTDVAVKTLWQHHLSFWICVGIAVVVFGIMIISLLLHRKSRGVTPATFHESTSLEVIWTIIPFVILGVLGYFAADSLKIYENVTGEKNDLVVKITGKQWRWHYEYVDNVKNLAESKGTVKFWSVINEQHKKDSMAGVDVMKKYAKDEKTAPYLLTVDKPLYLPTNRRILFLIKSDDVIHAWWVPKFAVKKDAIPHVVNTAWTKINKEGTYFGQCAELCGKEHAYMPIQIKAVKGPEFDKWLADARKKQPKAVKITSATTDKATLMKAGKPLYDANCAGCHKKTGEGLPPAFPALKGSKLVNGTDFKEQLRIILKGKGSMPKFPQLSDAEIAAIATYERNSWGNNGGTVTPKDVTAARK